MPGRSHGERDRHRVGAGIDGRRPDSIEERQRQHEHPVDEPEDAVVHDEERHHARPRHRRRRPPVHRPARGAARVAAFRAEDLQDVEHADDPVLEPVDDQDRPDAPAEEQDADERDEVRDDECDDRTDGRGDRVEGEEAIHARMLARTVTRRRASGPRPADGHGPLVRAAHELDLERRVNAAQRAAGRRRPRSRARRPTR